MKRFLTAMCIITAVAGAAQAGELQRLFGCAAGKVCVVSYSGGGELKDFEAARWEAERNGIQIRIIGFCGSACESILARSPNACAGPRAHFVAHRIAVYLPKNYIPGLPSFTGDEHDVSAAEVGIAPCR